MNYEVKRNYQRPRSQSPPDLFSPSTDPFNPLLSSQLSSPTNSAPPCYLFDRQVQLAETDLSVSPSSAFTSSSPLFRSSSRVAAWIGHHRPSSPSSTAHPLSSQEENTEGIRSEYIDVCGLVDVMGLGFTVAVDGSGLH
ncbi:uncharacterized protein A4U43_C06F11150 [Asparagus officinalis]|uniref:Uncharacterized protein n=1 Tax=Asparagus officinalis TaxID=4686 RepID=A0A5P1EPH6_ASPOF|nr:uncharacterized protein A4U43_C06F11150 [Asparagus officinalis]